jgi:hypothetical protein
LELKNPPGGKPVNWPSRDPLSVDPKHYTMEIDNSQVRVLRFKLDPHDRGVFCQHVLNRVVVFLTDGNVNIVAADGSVARRQYRAGQVLWDGPVTHTEQNVSEKPFEAVYVELKP